MKAQSSAHAGFSYYVDKEYKDACAKLTDATALWNHEWKIACDVSGGLFMK